MASFDVDVDVDLDHADVKRRRGDSGESIPTDEENVVSMTMMSRNAYLDAFDASFEVARDLKRQTLYYLQKIDEVNHDVCAICMSGLYTASGSIPAPDPAQPSPAAVRQDDNLRIHTRDDDDQRHWMALMCGHRMHTDCINKWLKTAPLSLSTAASANACPTCKVAIKYEDFPRLDKAKRNEKLKLKLAAAHPAASSSETRAVKRGSEDKTFRAMKKKGLQKLRQLSEVIGNEEAEPFVMSIFSFNIRYHHQASPCAMMSLPAAVQLEVEDALLGLLDAQKLLKIVKDAYSSLAGTEVNRNQNQDDDVRVYVHLDATGLRIEVILPRATMQHDPNRKQIHLRLQQELQRVARTVADGLRAGLDKDKHDEYSFRLETLCSIDYIDSPREFMTYIIDHRLIYLKEAMTVLRMRTSCNLCADAIKTNAQITNPLRDHHQISNAGFLVHTECLDIALTVVTASAATTAPESRRGKTIRKITKDKLGALLGEADRREYPRLRRVKGSLYGKNPVTRRMLYERHLLMQAMSSSRR
jgi:uncharacterized lipoprotein YehR (DUF1307 family)